MNDKFTTWFLPTSSKTTKHWHFERFTKQKHNASITLHITATGRQLYEYQFLCTHTCFAVAIIFVVPGGTHPSMLQASQDWQTPWQPLRLRVMGKGCFYLLMRSVPRAPNVSLAGWPSFPAAQQAGGSGDLKEQTWHRCHPSPAWRDRSRRGTGPENRKQKPQKLQSVPWRSTLLCITSSHANIPRSAGLEIWWIVKGLK